MIKKYGKNLINDFRKINSKELKMDWIDFLVFAKKIHKSK